MGWLDDPEVSPQAPAPAPQAAAAPGGTPAGWWEKDPIISAPAPQGAPREASGLSESIQAGLQGSALGIAWRGKLPDLISSPEHSKWWERAATGITQVGSELPLMVAGAIGGALTGAALGAAVSGPAAPAGGAIGAVLGAGAGMFGVPAAILESLIQAYKSGEVKTAADYWNILREVAGTTAKEAAIGAVTFGAGGIAARTLGKAIAPMIGESMSVPGAVRAIGATDTAAQIAAMTTMPAALQGRLPDLQEIMDAAIVIGGLKAAHVTANRVTSVFMKTGRTPAEQVADAQADPKLAEEMAAPALEKPEVEVPRGADGRVDMPTIQDALFKEIARVDELEKKAQSDATPLTDAERTELEGLKVKVSGLEEQLAAAKAAPAAASPDEPVTYTPEALTGVKTTADARIAELNAKAEGGQLTDAERAERVFLTNSLDKPEALARHFGIEPAAPTPIDRATHEASAQRVYDDVLRQVQDADQARKDAGLQPLGEDHAHAVAALVRARVRTRAARLGVLPEAIYGERPLQIVDDTAAEVRAAEAAIPPDAPRFTPPETDLFGNPVEATNAPRHGVANVPIVRVPLADIILSKEVPQFKSAADTEGVVVPLGGEVNEVGMGPVQLWERLRGQLELISGRHRRELFIRKGMFDIPAQIHREADGFDARQAAVLDAELNIRDEQGSVADYVQYFKTSGKSREAANAEGLLARAKGKTGFAIARDGSDDLVAAHRAGGLSDEAALSISASAPGSDRLQALGITEVQHGKSILHAVNMMKAVDVQAAERMAAGQQGDLWNLDDSAMREAAAMAKRASSKQRGISEQISAVSGASKRPEIARKLGVDVQDPEGIQKKIVELRQEQYLWDNWPLYPDLVAKLRDAGTLKTEKDGKTYGTITGKDYRAARQNAKADADINRGEGDSGIPGDVARQDGGPGEGNAGELEPGRGGEEDPNDLKQGPVEPFDLKPETPAELKARDEEAAAAAKRKIERESVTESPAFRAWFGESKVVDANGKPLVVYHGTDADITSFDPGSLGFNTDAASAKKGFFFTNNPRAAGLYPVYPQDALLEILKVIPKRTSGLDAALRNTEEYKQAQDIRHRLNALAKEKDIIRASERGNRISGPIPLADAFDRDRMEPLRVLLKASDSAIRETPEFKAKAEDSSHARDIAENDNLLALGSKAEKQIENILDQAKTDRRITYDERHMIQSLLRKHDPLLGYELPGADFSLLGKDARAIYEQLVPLHRIAAEGLDWGFIYKWSKQAWEGGDQEGEAWDAKKTNPAPNIMPVFLAIKNPLVHEQQTQYRDKTYAALIDEAKQKGNDGLIIRNSMDPLPMDVYVAFGSEQIKGQFNRGTWDPGDPNILHQSKPDTWYYSELSRQVDTANMKQAPAQGWKDWLKSLRTKGVKTDEIKWSGLDEYLDLQEGKVTKEQVAAFLKSGGVKVEEVMLGGDADLRTPEDPQIKEDVALLNKHGLSVDEDPTNEETGDRRFGVIDPDGDIYTGKGEADPDNFVAGETVTDAIDRVIGYLNDGQGATGATKFSQYVLPGGKNYRELLLTLPPAPDTGRWKLMEFRSAEGTFPERAFATQREAIEEGRRRGGQQPTKMIGTDTGTFTSSHFATPNIAAHIRFNERTDAEGKRVLFVEEIQSDWAQKGRSEGFKQPPKEIPHALPEGSVVVVDRSAEDNRDADEAAYVAGDLADAEHAKRTYLDLGVKPEDIIIAASKNTAGDAFNVYVTNYMVQDANGEILPNHQNTQSAYSEAMTRDAVLRTIQKQAAIQNNEKKIHAAPFVEKTEAWTALAIKRMIRYAAENGFDKVAWTRGEQQVERYTSALRKAVDAIEWKKTPEGIHLEGYKGRSTGMPREIAELQDHVANIDRDRENVLRMAGVDDPRDLTPNLRLLYDQYTAVRVRAAEDLAQKERKGTKVVDTTEKETALSDAIGKAMAERIIKDPAQSGTIEGENIKIDDTGMAGFYDRMLPSITKEVLKRLGGGKVGTTKVEIHQPEKTHIDIRNAITRAEVPNFRVMDAVDRDRYEGSTDFEHMPNIPILAEAQLLINGEQKWASVSADEAGLHIIDEDAANEFMVPRQVFETAGHPWTNANEAQHAIEAMWRDQNSQMWAGIEHIVGDAEIGPIKPQAAASALSEHQSFDITPELKEKALQGLPLFQTAPGEHRGSYQVAENLITIMQGADKSTVVHELGHSWLEEMKADAARPDAPLQIKNDWDILRAELAIGADGRISRESHEQWARTVERYLAEGEAPSVELRSVFERFKEWLLQIYESLGNLRATVNPEVKGVLDRMLATDQEIAAAKELDVPRAYVPEAMATVANKIVPPPEARRKIEPGFAAENAAIQPYADELPPGPGEAPDTSHVNYQYINTPMDVKLAMQRMAEIDQAHIQHQRGGTEGVKSWEDANAEQARYLNDVLGGDADTLKILQPTDPTAPKIDARLGIMKKLMVGAAKDSAARRDVILAKGEDATVREQLEYLGSIERARMIQAEFLGERASVARALNALKDSTEGSGEIGRMLEAIGVGDENTLLQAARTPAEEQAYMKAKLDEILQNYKGKSVLDIAKLHKEIGTLKGTFKMAKELEKATTWEQVVEGWRSGLLSGPVTHTTNLFGTGAFQVMRAPVEALAAIIGLARGASPGMGESDRASMSEAVSGLTAYLGATLEGIKVGYHTFALDDPTGKTEAYRTAIPDKYGGNYIRIPLRLMGAEDAMVTTMYTRKEITQQAIRTAFDEGLNPSTREFAERVDHLKDNPTPEMTVAAETAATRMTFNAPLGEKGAALQNFVREWNLQWLIPFIRTPINIAKELLRMSPFAPAVSEWRAAISKGGVERDRAIAEMAVGTAVMTATVAYAFAGNISGAGSPDPGKNKGKAGVWQPYSVLVGDTWYEYGRIQPTGTLMGMAADMAAMWDHMDDEEKNVVPKMLATAFAQAITNQTFLQGITNVVNATSDPARFGPRFLQQFAGSLVPNIVGQPTTMADPVVRQVNSMLEAVQARIPGMRQDLLPKRDWLGEPVQTKERMGVVMPVREQPVSEDKVRLEAARMDLSMADAPKKTHIGKGTGKLGDVELTPEERDAFAKVGGTFAHQILDNIVNAPGYDAIPDLVKRQIFSKVIAASHRVAAVQAMPIEKRVAYIQSISEKVSSELAPGGQE